MYQLLLSILFFFVIFTSCFQSSGNPQYEQLAAVAGITEFSSSDGQVEIPEEAPKITILSVSPENYKPGDLVTIDYKITQVGTGDWTGPVSFYLTDTNNCMEYCQSTRDTLNNPWIAQDLGNFTSYFNSSNWPYGNYNFSLLVNNQIVAKSEPLESVITHATASTLTMNGSAVVVTITSGTDEKLFKLNVGPTYKDFVIGINLITTGTILDKVSLYPPGTNGSDLMKNVSVGSGSYIQSKGSAHYPQATGNYEILASDTSGSFPISFSIQARNTHASGGGSCNYVGSFFESKGCFDYAPGTTMDADECGVFDGVWSTTQTCAQRNPTLTVLKKCTRFTSIAFSTYEFETQTYYPSTSNSTINCSDGF
ncbi:hypothetical protein AB3N61_12630 [Leptospira sp. WS58.C1]|uniref:hypothetical protein n=1 Tax=Leptospira TaxID=171 RepID=UPI0002BF1B57|nr:MULTISPECIES: hypothetical protein [unclassified Leptospira]EMK00931.1 hypothetical protein LEP1GSC192_1871 [Leptospira sp. B5-022]MCR1794198.1 hypothetical protein [Leptospira sp. id769339]